MKQYSVKQLAKLAGISVRTLHLYDQIGLLKPAIRTEARYRMYGEAELLRLQQILFYKELDFSLQEDPQSAVVQQQIARHYHNIRGFWDTVQSPDLQAEAYAGLGDLYVADKCFTMVDGKANPEYAQFLQKAMRYFADTQPN